MRNTFIFLCAILFISTIMTTATFAEKIITLSNMEKNNKWRSYAPEAKVFVQSETVKNGNSAMRIDFKVDYSKGRMANHLKGWPGVSLSIRSDVKLLDGDMIQLWVYPEMPAGKEKKKINITVYAMSDVSKKSISKPLRGLLNNQWNKIKIPLKGLKGKITNVNIYIAEKNYDDGDKITLFADDLELILKNPEENAKLNKKVDFKKNEEAWRNLGKEEILYNGISIGSYWPPRDYKLTYDPMPVPYLQNPPAIIPINIGRQLFVDNFLIEKTNLEREYYQPQYYKGNPVFEPETKLEIGKWKMMKAGPMAAPFSGGIWYNPANKRFEMWYTAGYTVMRTCFAYSKDGINWIRPKLDIVPGTNVVYKSPALTVWMDLEEQNPKHRFKLIYNNSAKDLVKKSQVWDGSLCAMVIACSPDGIHWSKPVARTGPAGDRNSFFYNPFRKRWIFSIRAYEPYDRFPKAMRLRRYWESPDMIKNLPWDYHQPPLWVGVDDLDKSRAAYPCELYNLDAVAYESIMVGLFAVHRKVRDDKERRAKINDLCIGFSRDGFHWSRPERKSFLPVSEDKSAWNRGNVQSVGGVCLVVKDKLYFYMSGRKSPTPECKGISTSTGLAFLRRDGFASMNAGGEEGTLVTRPLSFKGNYVFVNTDTKNGELRVELLDKNNKIIEPYSKANCIPIKADSTIKRVTWKNANKLNSAQYKNVKLKFYLKNGKLFSFWVSPNKSGASHGYVAAGGPGFTGASDTVGEKAYR
jgi:hypothetical protein